MKKLRISEDIITSIRTGENKFIYFLFKGKEIVYIGKSDRNVLGRINTHLKTKDFDDVYYLLVDSDEDLNKVESNLISRHKPKYNIASKNNYIKPSKALSLIIKSNKKTRFKIKEILELQPDLSSKTIGELISKSRRSVERHRKLYDL